MSDLSHVDPSGKARMVDISAKPVTQRLARASGCIRMQPATLEAIRQNAVVKGDVLAVARVAGILGAKRTWEIVPLCHQIPLSDVSLTMELDDSLPGVRVTATAKTAAQTGVEMEALVAVTVTLVTIFDMIKGLDKSLEIGEIRVIEKRGGKGGDWVRG
ncbi:MAG TPA: cyclic pyranopterin monophosphate synthase MoaC [Gemmatimonadaceae bacterium]|nr:cyclic pyranopterin monophosphate synthase MoaC [Gemmatimonadaceae bacterium]